MRVMKYALGMVWICCAIQCQYKLPVRDARSDDQNLAETRTFLAETMTGKPGRVSDGVLLDSTRFYWTLVLQDTQFTDKDRASIRFQFQHPSIRQWTESMVAPWQLIPDSIAAKAHGKGGWSIYHQYYPGGFYRFGYPIFFRQYSLCLFYTEFSSGRYDAGGSLNLYQKKGGHWILLKYLTDWEASLNPGNGAGISG